MTQASPAGDRGIVTPEAVLLEFSEAGLGSRSLSFVVDLGVRVGILWAVAMGTGLLSPFIGETGVVIVLVPSIFVILFVYPVFCETMWRGRTVGMMVVGLRVVTVEGAPERFVHSVIRSALGVVDFWISVGTVAIISSLVTRRSQRLGDLAAGTIVVRERQAVSHAQPIIFRPPSGWEDFVARLDVSMVDEAMYVIIRGFLLRVHELREGARHERATELANWLAETVPVDVPEPQSELFLVAVASAYQSRHSRHEMSSSAAPSAAQDQTGAAAPPPFLPVPSAAGAVPPPVWVDDDVKLTWGTATGPS